MLGFLLSEICDLHWELRELLIDIKKAAQLCCFKTVMLKLSDDV